MKDYNLQPYDNAFSSNSNFKVLRDLLPLSIPLSIIVDPANICNFRCTFCPTSHEKLLKQVGRPQGVMSYELFCKIIDDLFVMVQNSGQQIKRLHLMKDGEPLLNKRLGEMVAYAKKREVVESISTSTNGTLMTKQRSIELIENGLDVIRFSVEHVSDEGYKSITGSDIKYEEIRKNVMFLYEEKKRRSSPLKIYVKIIDIDLTPEQKAKFVDDFSSISDLLNFEKLHGWSGSKGDDFTLGVPVSTGWDGVTELKKRKICPEPFSKLAINFDGQVSICCVDWSFGTIVGNLCHESLNDIWDGERLRDFRLLHLKGDRQKISVCDSCQFIEGLPEYTMLDNCAKELLKIYSKQKTLTLK